MTDFTQLGLAAPLLQALATEGYTTPTPIQLQSIPHVLAGRDLLGIAQTGTGKTAAFALPILQRLGLERRPTPRGGCRALVLSPTRELASQIADSFRAYGRHMGLSVAVVFGGVSHGPQNQALRRGVDIVVATPGRLLDHLDQRTTRLDQVEVLVLDEADHMLDLGFIHAIRRLVPMLPKQRQSLFFSATMPKEIGTLAGSLLTNPEKVQVTPVATTVDRVDQRVIMVDAGAKRGLLAELLRDPAFARTLVFTRTKHGADRVVEHLERGGIPAAAIHGNKSQGQRERALDGFKSGRTRILVATDIAARGIDVDNVSHVINFDLPNVPESYVHRIGRTARAGAEGIAISFCSAEERAFLRDIEKLVRRQIPASSHKGSGLSQPEERRPHQPHGKPAHRKGHRHGSNSSHAGQGGHRGQRSERGDQRDGQPPPQPNGHAQPHEKPAGLHQGKPAHQGQRHTPSGQQPRRGDGIGGMPFMQARPKGGRHAA